MVVLILSNNIILVSIESGILVFDVLDGDVLLDDSIYEGLVSLSSSDEGISGYLVGSGSSFVSICSVSGVDESVDGVLI